MAVALALTGDRAALRLGLDRIAPCPKDAPVSFAMLPLSEAQGGGAQAMAALALYCRSDRVRRRGVSVR